MDLSSLVKACERDFNSKKEIIDYYEIEEDIIGYLPSNQLNPSQRFTENIQSSILNNVVGVNSITEGQKLGIENFLIKNETNLRYFMQVIRNESLVKEKIQQQKKKSKPLAKNVIVIYIDALSRAHAHRKINKTLKWFEEGRINPDSEKTSYEFFRYHSGAPFTFPNAFKFFYGHYITHLELELSYILQNKDLQKKQLEFEINRLLDKYNQKALPINFAEGEKYKSFLQIYKEQGFVVGHATDFCSVYSVSNNPEYENIYDFEPADHENYVQACDLNYEKQNSEWDLTQGPYSPLPRCLYGKNVFEYILDYGEQFLDAYKDERKLLYMEFMDAHEGTGEVISQMDQKLNEFLIRLEKKKIIDDSVVLLFADHGLHMQGPLRILNLDGVDNEIALPAMFLSLPKKIDQELVANVEKNQQKLVHAENIFNFFIQILNGNQTEDKVKEYSLFGDLPVRADCNEAFQWNIKMFCACEYE